MDIKKKLQQVPSAPGIYIMKGAGEKVLYVGKAKSLKNRLRSYFQKSASLGDRKSKMVQEIKTFEYVVTKNELEALVLEANFIKKLKPRFNIILRDDKNYPYLKLTVNEKWPRLAIVRKIDKDGALYFGPYVPAGTMWEMVKFIRRHFPIRICKYNLGRPFRPCVQYQMGRCLAPCSESLRRDEDWEIYQETAREVRSFIQGDKRELLANLHNRMHRLSEELKFEEAARIRDRLKALEGAWESQRVITPELGDMDVLGLYRAKEEASVFILFLRKGMVVGQKDFFMKKLGDMEDRELIESFVGQFYSKEMLLPSKVVLPVRAGFQIQKQWLQQKRGRAIKLAGAKGEHEHKILKMANDNAYYSFNKHKNAGSDEALVMLKNILTLKAIPRKIVAIDVSNISGSESVGACVLYEEGKFRKNDYRLFKIKTVKGIDDVAMIGEVVDRYLKSIADSNVEAPQLLLIDGGRGQLQYALSAAKQFDLSVEIAAIAKAREKLSQTNKKGIRTDCERVYIPGKRAPVYLEPFLSSTYLLQKIRDEVHRFAIGYHRKLRSMRTFASPLEKVKGIGKTRRLLLLRHFGSIDKIRKARVEDISALKGMNRKIADDLKKSLN
jgi:excinuclease ABC subunit C